MERDDVYLTQGLHRSVSQCPDKIALVNGDRQFTHTELIDRIGRLAAALAGLGAAEGDRIGILATNSAEYVEYALACPWGGFVLAPINNRWSLTEMAYQVDDAEITVLITDPASLAQARELRDKCSTLASIVCYGAAQLPDDCLDYEDLITASTPMADRRLSGDALAAILYTGGTTGVPKGVMLGPGQIMVSGMGSLLSAGLPNRPERFLHVSPLYHMAALAGIYQQVMLGSTQYVLGEFDVHRLAETIERERITATTLVPTMIQRLLTLIETTGADLSSLIHLGYGASPISETVLRQGLRLLPHLQMCQRYGMTELGPVATLLTPADHRDVTHPQRLRSAGRAAMHTEVRVVGENGEEMPVGQVGEVVVRGGNIMLGYWKKPAETAHALRGGWMHTGDMGYFDDDGYLYVVDRLKDMIVTGGENVYSAEVESVLSLHESVASCAVIGVPDPDWGERVHAVVVLTPGHESDASTLREFCAQYIARYKAPRTVEFVPALPLSPVGKILKRTLREQHNTSMGQPS